MKLNVLALSFVLSTASFAGSYDLVSVPHSEIDSHLVIGNDATGTPTNLQGLWWMNGNPLADEVVSFAGTKWQEVLKDGEVVGYTTSVPVFDEGVWSWHDSLGGRWLYKAVLANRLVYVATFNKDFTYGEVLPTIKPVGLLPTLTIPASLLVKFTMTQVDENEFRRDSILLGQPSAYRFRRIVDADGQRLPAFDEFLEKVEVPNALLPICKNKSNTTLPTSCAE